MTPRRRGALALAIVTIVVATILVRLLDHGSTPVTGSTGASTQSTDPTPMRPVAQVMSRGLPAPVSGEAASTLGGKVWIAGGLDSAGASANGVFALDPKTG